MGLFDYTIQCFVGDYKQSVKLAEKLFNDDIPQDHITVGDEPRVVVCLILSVHRLFGYRENPLPLENMQR